MDKDNGKICRESENVTRENILGSPRENRAGKISYQLTYSTHFWSEKRLFFPFFAIIYIRKLHKLYEFRNKISHYWQPRKAITEILWTFMNRCFIKSLKQLFDHKVQTFPITWNVWKKLKLISNGRCVQMCTLRQNTY